MKHYQYQNVQQKLMKFDIVLLGPQVRFQKPVVEKLAGGRIPVEVIDNEIIWNNGWKININKYFRKN